MVGLCAREGSAAATLVVVHDAEGGTQPVNLRHEVLVVEVRTTVHYDDRQPITEIADKQAHTIERHEALASDRSRRTWTHGLILPRAGYGGKLQPRADRAGVNAAAMSDLPRET